MKKTEPDVNQSKIPVFSALEVGYFDLLIRKYQAQLQQLESQCIGLETELSNVMQNIHRHLGAITILNELKAEGESKNDKNGMV